MTCIAFTLRGQCVSLKNAYRVITIAGHGSLKKSDEMKAYERSVLLQIPAEARQELEGPVRVTFRAYYTWEGPDLDCAVLLDLMQTQHATVRGKLLKVADGKFKHGPGTRVVTHKGVYGNDRQVRELHLYHGIDKVNPRVEVTVEALQPQQAGLVLGDDFWAARGQQFDPRSVVA